ncbi:unnamed protein product [Prunus armeniaca]
MFENSGKHQMGTRLMSSDSVTGKEESVFYGRSEECLILCNETIYEKDGMLFFGCSFGVRIFFPFDTPMTYPS